MRLLKLGGQSQLRLRSDQDPLPIQSLFSSLATLPGVWKDQYTPIDLLPITTREETTETESTNKLITLHPRTPRPQMRPEVYPNKCCCTQREILLALLRILRM